MNATVNWPEVSCCMGDEKFCVCGDAERSLRAWVGRNDMPPMTPEQRSFCLDEIGRVEGWVREEHVNDTPEQLARNTLSAWSDYAHDKGLI